MKTIMSIVCILVLFITVDVALAGQYTGKNIQAKFASAEIEGDFMTVWGRKFADHMKKWSDGKIDITVYPLGTLGSTLDIQESAQRGVVQFVFSASAWISALIPQAQVLTLNYLYPTEKVTEVQDWIMRKGEFMPLLEKSFKKNNLLPLGMFNLGWMWLTSKKEIKSLDDIKGLKLRLMASKLLVENYRGYGVAPTPMGFGEVYSGLQMGLIDAQINPIWAIYSMKFYEVQDYITLLKNEMAVGIPSVNKQFFESLPENAQQEIRRFWRDEIIPAGKFIDELIDVDRAKIEKSRPKIKFTVLDDAAIAAFKARAENVYPKYVEIGGEGSQEVLNALLKDINNAKKALGVK
jgi:tripartite ATP-independent transporter DctP family solute receptor